MSPLRAPEFRPGLGLVWRTYAVRAWPTVVLLHPEGHVVGWRSGEDVLTVLDEAVGALVEHFTRRGLLRGVPLERTPERDAPESGGTLAFPGKVLAHDGSLFIADTSHHRILWRTVDGPRARLRAVIGSRREGLEGGSFASAAFRQPQETALLHGALDVSDTENLAIRRVTLPRGPGAGARGQSGKAETVAGTGRQVWNPRTGGPARETPLNSLRDLVAVAGALYLAMAGRHQLWRLDPDTALTVKTIRATALGW